MQFQSLKLRQLLMRQPAFSKAEDRPKQQCLQESTAGCLKILRIICNFEVRKIVMRTSLSFEASRWRRFFVVREVTASLTLGAACPLLLNLCVKPTINT